MNTIKICKIAYIALIFIGIGMLGIAFAFSINLDGYCTTPHHCLQVEVGEAPPKYLGWGNPTTLTLFFYSIFPIMGAMLPAYIEEQLKLREKNDY